jgi:rsbT co-antagonist protein RsbR
MAKEKEKKGIVTGTPVSILWEGILLIPIFGILDSLRSRQVMEAILNKLLETGSKTIILDILGVEYVDTAVANRIVKITQATKLMGAECIISGVSPAIAQTIVELGVNLGNTSTMSTLRNALELAFEMNGLEVGRKEGSKKKGT